MVRLIEPERDINKKTGHRRKTHGTPFCLLEIARLSINTYRRNRRGRRQPRLLLVVLGRVGDQGVGGQEQRADAGGVLEGVAGDLGRVDDAGLDQVGVLVLERVVAEVALALDDLGDDHAAVLAGIVGDLVERGRAGADDDLVADLAVVGEVLGLDGRARARSSATPPPGRIPSSRAARVACRASSTRAFFSFISLSVAAPTLILATPPASLASRSSSFSRS